MDFRIAYRRPLRTAALLRRKRQRTRLWVGMVAVIAAAVTACSWDPAPSELHSAAAAAPAVQLALSTTAPAPGGAVKRVYPYSIVPGGVDSRADLEHQVATDHVVAEHYASFDIKKAYAVTVARARAVHVSYRKGGKVYWTARKVMLVEGETLLSDGTSEIRGRCGNRISDTARLPVAPGEPSAAELDQSSNVAPGAVDEGGLQYASFTLDDPVLPGNPTQFQRFPGSGLTSDAVPVTPPTRPGMPSVPLAPPNGMGLVPGNYLTVSAGPALALGPATIGSNTVTPPAPTAITPPPAATTPAPVDTVPPPVTPIKTPDTPVKTPDAPVTPPLPHGDIPEPGTLWLVGAAIIVMCVTRRKRRVT
jgi:hypothetical protein